MVTSISNARDWLARVRDLESVFGAPAQSGFGSSVFFIDVTEQKADLEADALAKYRFFVGDAWDKLGEENWMGSWTTVYARTPESSTGILVELKSIPDFALRQVANLLLENSEDIENSSRVLQQAFDHEDVSELRIFSLGDGAAMSGVMIAARITNIGSLFLALLLD